MGINNKGEEREKRSGDAHPTPAQAVYGSPASHDVRAQKKEDKITTSEKADVLDSPERNRHPHPIQARTCDLCDVLLGLWELKGQCLNERNEKKEGREERMV